MFFIEKKCLLGSRLIYFFFEQVLKLKIDLLAYLGKNTVFTKVSAGFVLSDLVDKVGDVKNGSGVQEALSCIAESCSLEFVGKEVSTETMSMWSLYQWGSFSLAVNIAKLK